MKFFFVGIVLFLSACNTMPIPTQKIVVGDPNETIGTIDDSSYPLEATKYVSLHADRTLKLNRSCTQEEEEEEEEATFLLWTNVLRTSNRMKNSSRICRNR